MENRKYEEAKFHDFIRDQSLAESGQKEYYTSNKKFYAVVRASKQHSLQWLRHAVSGKRVLDYGCGDGELSFQLAEFGAGEVIGIDISPVSVENCKREAIRRGLGEICSFEVTDAENMAYPDCYFDVVVVYGVLHHLDVSKAFPQLARVLKPEGKVMCLEALGHNPVFQWYRRRTPQLRTAWETDHIIRHKDLDLAQHCFGQIDMRCFHLAVLLAVPFRNTSLFLPLLASLEAVDKVLMRLPVVKWQCWMIWFVLSQPLKG